MPELTGTSSPIMSSQGTDAFIAGHSLKFYWQATRLFLALLLLLDILNIIFGVLVWGHWIAEAVVFILLNFWLWKK